MNLLQRLFNKRKKERTIVTTHTLGKQILEKGKVLTPIYTKNREYKTKITLHFD